MSKYISEAESTEILELSLTFDDSRLEAIVCIEDMLELMEFNKDKLKHWKLDDIKDKLNQVLDILDKEV